MGDFFYYGQKDTIRRLNELAGRGAVVASYAPAVGRSPLGGPNGYMNPAWLDPSISLNSTVPAGFGAANKYGYNFIKSGASVHSFYKLATLQADNLSSFSSLCIDAMIGEWSGGTLSPVTIVIGSRNAAGSVKVEWSYSRELSSAVKFLVYKESSGEFSVYLYFSPGAYAQASLQIMCMGAITYALPVEASSVTGVITWDSSTTLGNASYIAPRWRGYGKGLLVNEQIGTGDGTVTTSFLSGGVSMAAAGQERDSLRLGVGGVPGTSYPGCFSWFTSGGNSNGTPNNLYKTSYRMALRAYDTESNAWSGDLIALKGTGHVFVPILKAGTTDTLSFNQIAAPGVEGADVLQVVGSVGFRKCNNDWGNLSNAAIIVQANSLTNRSSNNKGTVNTMGNDYAEYIFKSLNCGIVTPGQIVGITADNKVTDKWADAVMFSIKSTAPSFVGGDTWASDVGSRPSPQAGPAPTQPLRREDVLTQQPVPGTNPPEFEDVVTESGDTDDEWAEKLAIYTAALAAHNIAVQQDAEAIATFDAALEVERQKVDRIAIAGRVPVNVQGAQPGDYIVPVQDGAGIKGIAVHEDDLSMKQYFRAVGRVISIEQDGRAYVMVKVV